MNSNDFDRLRWASHEASGSFDAERAWRAARAGRAAGTHPRLGATPRARLTAAVATGALIVSGAAAGGVTAWRGAQPEAPPSAQAAPLAASSSAFPDPAPSVVVASATLVLQRADQAVTAANSAAAPAPAAGEKGTSVKGGFLEDLVTLAARPGADVELLAADDDAAIRRVRLAEDLLGEAMGGGVFPARIAFPGVTEAVLDIDTATDLPVALSLEIDAKQYEDELLHATGDPVYVDLWWDDECQDLKGAPTCEVTEHYEWFEQTGETPKPLEDSWSPYRGRLTDGFLDQKYGDINDGIRGRMLATDD
jgi:hypothetical protein